MSHSHSNPHAHAAPSARLTTDAAFKAKLQELRRADNLTNWYYLARTYAYLALVIGGAVAFDLWRQSAGYPWWASIPVFALAVVLVGAGQHQLSGLAHEGSHHILFRNRQLNELASDILCMYPLFSSTYHYRLQHLAHHQFVNDPERDPDLAQLEASGHRLAFPLPRREARRALLRQLRPTRLLAYIRARAVYGAAGAGRSPYAIAGKRSSKVAVRIGAAGMLAQFVVVVAAVALKSTLLLAAVPPLFALTALAFVLLPKSMYLSNRLHPVISLRWLAVLRVGYLAALFNALGWIQLTTGAPALAYYFALWVLPMLTSYSFFMILRQTVQHGNGDRGWLTNTRVFFVHDLIRFAVFPAGQDYHLPHHLYATVPHYRLAKLHAELLTDPEYAEHATEVHGYFAPPHTDGAPQTRPTAIDVLGPDYAPRALRPAHFDHSVLDDCVVEGRDEVLRGAA